MEHTRDSALRAKARQSRVSELIENPQDAAQFDQELSRAISLVLYGSRFDTVTMTALQSLTALVDEYMTHFASRVAKNMTHCRRAAPIPQDFAYALSQFGIEPHSLLEEHDLFAPSQITQPPIIPVSTSDSSLFGDGGRDTFISQRDAQERTSESNRLYVPKGFPNLPSRHAYQATPVFNERDEDILSIRERAMKEGEHAEKALRKLLGAQQESGSSARLIECRRPKEVEEQSERLRNAALAALDEELTNLIPNRSTEFSLKGEIKDTMGDSPDEFIPASNYDRRYWRNQGPRQGSAAA